MIPGSSRSNLFLSHWASYLVGAR